LFVFDAQSPHDLMDYWNLRAVRANVLPVPLQWLPELSPFCRRYITENFRPLPNNPHGVMINDWTFEDVAAIVFPIQRGAAFLPRLGIGGQLRLSTTEGVVVFPMFTGHSEHWDLPSGAAAIGGVAESERRRQSVVRCGTRNRTSRPDNGRVQSCRRSRKEGDPRDTG
jgi:hypothetical protein